jgi:hypothetical protein
MLVIHDEQLIKALQQIAEREKRSVEDVLWSMIEWYERESGASTKHHDKDRSVKLDRAEA